MPLPLFPRVQLKKGAGCCPKTNFGVNEYFSTVREGDLHVYGFTMRSGVHFVYETVLLTSDLRTIRMYPHTTYHAFVNF